MNDEKKMAGWDFCCPIPSCEQMTGVGFGVMEQKEPVLIVFDLDGTLTDSRLLGRELFKRVFSLLGYGEISDALADAFNGPSADEVCRIMGVGPERRALYDSLIDEVEPQLVREIGVVYPGVLSMLEALAPHAVLAILTNGSQVYCRTCMEEYGFAPYISLSSGFVSGVSKAARMKEWAQNLGARRIICIGDRGTDVENGRRVNAVTIAVTYGMGEREEFTAADVVCDTTAQVTRECLRVIGEY